MILSPIEPVFQRADQMTKDLFQELERVSVVFTFPDYFLLEADI